MTSSDGIQKENVWIKVTGGEADGRSAAAEGGRAVRAAAEGVRLLSEGAEGGWLLLVGAEGGRSRRAGADGGRLYFRGAEAGLHSNARQETTSRTSPLGITNPLVVEE